MPRRWSFAILLLLGVVLVLGPLAVLAAPPAQTCGPSVLHTVQRGENVFRISLRYGTTMAAIAAANGLPNVNRIYVGQRLIIPCAGSAANAGFIPTPPPVIQLTPVVVQPPAGAPVLGVVVPPSGNQAAIIAPLTANCAGFRPTSPLQGLAYSTNVFYWDSAPGATGYRVNVFNIDRRGGAMVGSYETGAFANSLSADLSEGNVGPGFEFAWEVQALVSGQVACTSPRLRMFRASPTNPPPQPPTPIPVFP